MRILSLDLGKRRTGVAFADNAMGIPLAVDTVQSKNEEDLIGQILLLCDERDIDIIVIGLPLLPSGVEGEQSAFVHFIGDRLEQTGIHIEYLDERYTTSKDTSFDGDAKAACDLLQMYLQRS